VRSSALTGGYYDNGSRGFHVLYDRVLVEIMDFFPVDLKQHKNFNNVTRLCALKEQHCLLHCAWLLPFPISVRTLSGQMRRSLKVNVGNINI